MSSAQPTAHSSPALPYLDKESQSLSEIDPFVPSGCDPELGPTTTDPLNALSESLPEMTRRISMQILESEEPLPVDIPFHLLYLREGTPIPTPLAEKADEFIVAFNGPQDTTNPKHWSTKTKAWNTLNSIIPALIVSLDSSIYTPTASAIAEEFGVAEVVALLGLSLFVLGFATGPVFGGPLSELFGRKVVLIISMAGFTLFSFAVATAKDLQTVLICRFFASVMGSPALVVAPGVIADMYDDKYRGIPMTVFVTSMLMIPIPGPTIGGFVVKSHLGWRWPNYLCGITGAAVTVSTILCFKESNHGVILSAKAAKIREITKVWAIHAAHEEKTLDFHEIFNNNIARPLRMLCTEPILALMSIYVTFVYGILYLLLPAYPVVFSEGYEMMDGVSDLPYLSIAIGMGFAGLFGIYCEKFYIAAMKQNNGKAVPEARLIPMKVGCFFFPLGLFWFFWTGNYPDRVHWMAPTAAGVFIGFGLLSIFNSALNYLVDSYVYLAASAMAANAFLRSVFAASTPLFATAMLHNMGINWSGVLLGSFGFLLCAVPFLFSKYGQKIRSKSKYAFDLS